MKASLAIAVVVCFIGSACAEYKPPAWAQPKPPHQFTKQAQEAAQKSKHAQKDLSKSIQQATENMQLAGRSAERSLAKASQDQKRFVNDFKKNVTLQNQNAMKDQMLAKRQEQRTEDKASQEQKRSMNGFKKNVQMQNQKAMKDKLLAKRQEQRTEDQKVEQQAAEQKAANAFMKNFKAKQDEAFKNAAVALKKAHESQKQQAAKNFEKMTASLPTALRNLRKKADHAGHQSTKHHQNLISQGYKNVAKLGHDAKKKQLKGQREAHRAHPNSVQDGGLAFDAKRFPKAHSGPYKGHRVPEGLPMFNSASEKQFLNAFVPVHK